MDCHVTEGRVLLACLIGTLVLIVSCVCIHNIHTEKMADKGYCQTTVVGNSGTYWHKCN